MDQENKTNPVATPPPIQTEYSRSSFFKWKWFLIGLMILVPVSVGAFWMGRESVQNKILEITPTQFQPTPSISAAQPTESQVNNGIKITNISPSSGPVNTTVTISGWGFTSSANIVIFGDGFAGKIPGFSSNDGNTIIFTIPAEDNPTCPDPKKPCPIRAAIQITPGLYEVYITNSNGTSNKFLFTVTGNGLDSCTTDADCGQGCNRCQNNQCVNICN